MADQGRAGSCVCGPGVHSSLQSAEAFAKRVGLPYRPWTDHEVEHASREAGAPKPCPDLPSQPDAVSQQRVGPES